MGRASMEFCWESVFRSERPITYMMSPKATVAPTQPAFCHHNNPRMSHRMAPPVRPMTHHLAWPLMSCHCSSSQPMARILAYFSGSPLLFCRTWTPTWSSELSRKIKNNHCSSHHHSLQQENHHEDPSAQFAGNQRGIPRPN